jgi:hypothetical protein
MIRTYLLAAALAGASIGCGLIDKDITNFDLSMPERTFTVDTAQWELTGEESFPEVSCEGMPGICSVAMTEHCGAEQFCFASCADGACKVTVLVALFTEVDMYAEKRELQSIDEQPLVSVTIDSVTYEVTENTMNVASPVLTLYVAPKTVMSPGDPQAQPVGVIHPISAGVLLGTTQVDLSAEGREALREYMRDYRTPFNVILGAELDLEHGDMVPQGRIVAKVNVTAYAGL